MSSNVGLSTPRGSGTSGYVQRNMSFLRPRDDCNAGFPGIDETKNYCQRIPDQSILEHDRKRQIEVECFRLQDNLEEEGKLDGDEIETRVQALRDVLQADFNKRTPSADKKGFKPHQVHEIAAAKIMETERIRSALGISSEYEEGSYWKRRAPRENHSGHHGAVHLKHSDRDNEERIWSRERHRRRSASP